MDDESDESCSNDWGVADSAGESSNDLRSDSSTGNGDDSSIDESFSISSRQQQQQHKDKDEDDDEFSKELRSWTGKVPIGLGLCPWAMKSQKQGRIKYRTCQGCLPSDVMALIVSEAKALCDGTQPPLSTTLVICPHVAVWRNNFHSFDEFVRNARSWSNEQCLKTAVTNGDNNNIPHRFDLLQELTLVAFHPLFLRWRGLPSGIGIGSVVQTPQNRGIFQRSPEIYFATVLETSNKMFGQRKIKVRFHDTMKEQYVPVNWLVATEPTPQSPPLESSGGNSSGDNGRIDVDIGQALPDNIMHRAPYPTVHLIRNVDLGKIPCRDISRVKRKNAQRMMKLGWEGALQKTCDNHSG